VTGRSLPPSPARRPSTAGGHQITGTPGAWHLDYRATPAPIAHWAENIALIDFDSLKDNRVPAYQILDDELIAAARENIERDREDPSIMTIRSDT
jgi:hypothetical protein